VKRNLPIVSAFTAVDLPIISAITTIDLLYGSSLLLVVHKCIYNETANNSLFKLKELGVQIDSICHRHGGTQKMVIQDDGESRSVPLELASCMIHFRRRLPNDEEFKSLKQYF
jgi:hypothetical protein